jgi:hypothetical protein
VDGSETAGRCGLRCLFVVVAVENWRHSFACTYARISDDRMRKREKTNRIGKWINNRETPNLYLTFFLLVVGVMSSSSLA